MVNFNQDFGAGFLGGLITGILALRTWQRFQQANEARRSSYRQMTRGNRALRTLDRRYINEFMRLAQAAHLAGGYVSLTDVLAEPRFIRAAELISKPDEDETVNTNVFGVVPQIHDYPFLHAPYNIPTLSIEDLGRGERNIALLGLPGSGRTVAMLTIALWSLRQVDFAPPPDSVSEQFEAEEGEAVGALPTAARAERIRNRVRARMSQAARRPSAGEDDVVEVPSFRNYAPIYVHLGDMNLSQFGRRIDPAEPLVRAMQTYLGRVTRKTMPRTVYRLLNRGQALVLIDGYDDLPADERAEKLAWIKAFVAAYAENFIIISGSPEGYQPLADVGVAPVYLRPWADAQIGELAQKWADAWPRIARESRPSEGLMGRLRFDSRALPAFDATLKAWSMYSAGSNSRGDWVLEYLERRIPDFEAWLPMLKRAASIQLDEGYITRARLIELEVDDPLGIPGRRGGGTEAGEVSARGRRRIASDQTRFVSLMQQRQLMRAFVGGRYQFWHPLIAAYLAGLWLADHDAVTLVSRMRLPAWEKAIAYAGQHMPLDLAVQQRLNEQPDILQTSLLKLTSWLSYLEADTTWRGSLLRYLGTQFVAPFQWTLMRERIAAALVSAREPGAMFIFRRALQSAIPDVARIAALALGVLRDESAVPQLGDLIANGSPQVQLAATMALGAIGTDDALVLLAETLQSANSNDVQRAAAETLAADRDAGYATLYDAVAEGVEISIRRAAVFGLGRVPTDWALIKVDEVALGEEEEYYVRSAALEVLDNLFGEEKQGAMAYPAPSAVPWLLEWAQGEIERGNIPHDIAGVPLLLHALEQTESAQIRELACATAGQLGVYDATATIYDILLDPDEKTRDLALRSLGELQTKMGAYLPRPPQ